MPNSYSVVPNVLPGNVTIGGNLIVSGNEIRIGGGPQFGRLFVRNNLAVNLSMNLQSDLATRDNAANPGRVLAEDLGNFGPHTIAVNTAGNQNSEALTQPIFTDYTQHVHTGTLTLDTIYSKLIRGGIIGANGGLHIHLVFTSTAQGAPNSNYRILLGAGQLLSLTFNVAHIFLVDLYVANRNAQNAQYIQFLQTDLTANTVTGFAGTAAVDTSVDQTLSVAAQNGTATDSQNFDFISARLLNSFGPV